MAEQIAFKAGVRVSILACNARLWEGIANTALTAPKLVEGTMVVTSVSDGEHQPDSCHHTGHAFDIRYRGIHVGAIDVPLHSQEAEAGLWAKRLGRALGPSWDIVVEEDHIHVEWDPK